MRELPRHKVRVEVQKGRSQRGARKVQNHHLWWVKEFGV